MNYLTLHKTQDINFRAECFLNILCTFNSRLVFYQIFNLIFRFTGIEEDQVNSQNFIRHLHNKV